MVKNIFYQSNRTRIYTDDGILVSDFFVTTNQNEKLISLLN